jgi:hypothetical protein
MGQHQLFLLVATKIEFGVWFVEVWVELKDLKAGDKILAAK